MQFIMTDVELIDNQELTNDDIIAYSLLCDRMKSSRTSKQFFDVKQNDYYVIYTIETLAKKLKVSERKTSNILKKLVKLGYVAKKKQFSRADKLFLPKLEPAEVQDVHAVDAESAGPYLQNLQPNHSHSNHKTNQRLVTSDTDDRTETMVDKWRTSVIDKLKLPELAVDRVLKYTHNDVKRAYTIIGLINKAKSNVARLNGLTNSPISKYENNANIRQRLATRLMHIFSYARNAKNESAYIMNGLKTFFKDAFGLVKDEIVKPEAKSKQPKKTHVEPEWITDPEGYNKKHAKPVSAEKKARIEAMLAKFYEKDEIVNSDEDIEAEVTSAKPEENVKLEKTPFDDIEINL